VGRAGRTGQRPPVGQNRNSEGEAIVRWSLTVGAGPKVVAGAPYGTGTPGLERIPLWG
jgi:hypothetical protein